MKSLRFVLVAVFLSGCASEEEKQVRRENAFDLAGIYTATQSSGSELDFVLNIQNETGRHDVLGQIERGAAQTTKEINFLSQKHKLDASRVATHFGRKLVMGRGQNNQIEGGENISDNFGESSRVSICTDQLQYDSSRKIYYCLRGSIKKSDYVLRGEMSLIVQTETTKVGQDGKEYKEIQVDGDCRLSFAASTELVYFTQYFSTWNGSVSLNENYSTNAANMVRFNIQRTSETTFQVLPSVASLSFEESNYVFENQSFDIRKLSDKAIPLVELVFKKSDSEKLVFFGQIRSLGNLTGSVVWISGNNKIQIGSFLFKRL